MWQHYDINFPAQWPPTQERKQRYTQHEHQTNNINNNTYTNEQPPRQNNTTHTYTETQQQPTQHSRHYDGHYQFENNYQSGGYYPETGEFTHVNTWMMPTYNRYEHLAYNAQPRTEHYVPEQQMGWQYGNFGIPRPVQLNTDWHEIQKRNLNQSFPRKTLLPTPVVDPRHNRWEQKQARKSTQTYNNHINNNHTTYIGSNYNSRQPVTHHRQTHYTDQSHNTSKQTQHNGQTHNTLQHHRRVNETHSTLEPPIPATDRNESNNVPRSTVPVRTDGPDQFTHNVFRFLQIKHHQQNWHSMPNSITQELKLITDNITPPLPSVDLKLKLNRVRENFQAEVATTVTDHLTQNEAKHLQIMQNMLNTNPDLNDHLEYLVEKGFTTLKERLQKRITIKDNHNTKLLLETLRNMKNTPNITSQINTVTIAPTVTYTENAQETLPVDTTLRMKPQVTRSRKLSLAKNRKRSTRSVESSSEDTSTKHTQKRKHVVETRIEDSMIESSGDEGPLNASPVIPLEQIRKSTIPVTDNTVLPTTIIADTIGPHVDQDTSCRPTRCDNIASTSTQSTHKIEMLKASIVVQSTRCIDSETKLTNGTLKSCSDTPNTAHVVNLGNISNPAEPFVLNNTKTWILTDSNGSRMVEKLPTEFLLTSVSGLKFQDVPNLLNKNIPPQVENIVFLIGINNRNDINTRAVEASLKHMNKIFSGRLFFVEIFLGDTRDIKINTNIERLNTYLQCKFPEHFIEIPQVIRDARRTTMTSPTENNIYMEDNPIHFTTLGIQTVITEILKTIHAVSLSFL